MSTFTPTKPISYGRQTITDADIAAVTAVLQSDYLTQGPKPPEFEAAFAQYIGSQYASVVANGAAALHLCAMALGVKPGDKAEIEVDAYPGSKLAGQVESISAATGAKFALLPPDNATGNFTKVVQRVPVKIRLQQDTAHKLPLRVRLVRRRHGRGRLRTGLPEAVLVALQVLLTRGVRGQVTPTVSDSV